MTRTLSSRYGRSQVGGIVWRQDIKAASLSVTTQDNYYWYDGLQQVTAHQRGQLTGTYPNYTGITGPQQEENFGYDPTGNWATYDILSPSNAQTRTHSVANEITGISSGLGSVTPTYSAVGNMTAAPVNPDLSTSEYTLTWDAWNRLVKVQNGSTTVATYAYDGLTRRIKKTTAAETDNYYYSKDWQVLEVLSTGSVATTQFMWGLRSVDDLIARNQIYSSASHWLYSLSDQWNVVAVTNASATVQERYGYNAFGTTLFMTASFAAESASSVAWETTFCSYRLDSETGFYQVRYRYLHPTLGRWLSRDPIGELWFESIRISSEANGTDDDYLSRVPTENTDMKEGPNLYAYVLNNPENKIDPRGLTSGSVLGLCSKAAAYLSSKCGNAKSGAWCEACCFLAAAGGSLCTMAEGAGALAGCPESGPFAYICFVAGITNFVWDASKTWSGYGDCQKKCCATKS